VEKSPVIEMDNEIKEETKLFVQELDKGKSPQERENQQKPIELTKTIKEKIIKEKPKSENQKKKKLQTSEPLTFLNEIIYKESENNQSADKINTKSYTDKEKENKRVDEQEQLIDHVHHMNKQEKHFLLLILDSTKIDSGYFSHSTKDELFNDFITKSHLSYLFIISVSEEQYRIQRKLSIEDKQYQTLRELIEESILGSFHDLEESLPDIQNRSCSETVEEQNTQLENLQENTKVSSLLDSFLIDETSTSTPDETEQNPHLTGESEDRTFELSEKKMESSETSDLFSIEDHEDEDVKHFFGISDEDSIFTEESDQENNEMTDIDKNQESIHSEYFIRKNDELEGQQSEVDDESKAESPSSHIENTKQFSGKVISVLTENQEKWLKIKMLSDVIGFELRDGLAYKPEIAVFDEGFSHLEPIAKSIGATILHINEFYHLLGLRDKN